MNAYVRQSFSYGLFMLSFLVLTSCADLVGTISCPQDVNPGQELHDSVSITVSNTGRATANNFSVDLILSSDTYAPVQVASYAPDFHEDVLLQGGREKLAALAPGESISVVLNGKNKVPDNTPPGRYNLGLVIDTGQSVAESTESNNTAFCEIQVNECMPVATIINAQIIEASGGTVGFARLRIGWSYSTGEVPNKLSITIYRLQGPQPGEWQNIMPSGNPYLIADPTKAMEDVKIFQLFLGDYRIQFNADYTCGRKEEYVFERHL